MSTEPTRPARRIPEARLAQMAQAAAKKKRKRGRHVFNVDDSTQRQIFVPNDLYDKFKAHKIVLDRGRKHTVALHDVLLVALMLGEYVMEHNLTEAIEAVGGMPPDEARARIVGLLPAAAAE